MQKIEELAIADLEHELSTTRRVLERIPDDKLDWSPHAKSKSLRELAVHLVEVVGMMIPICTQEELDFATSPPPPVGSTDRAAILEAFDRTVEAVSGAVRSLDSEAMTRTWTLRAGDHLISTQPRLVAIRTLGVSHLAHHRGQMTVYLRILEVPLPSVYGPTADEP